MTVTIALPDDLAEFLDAQVEAGRYGSPGEAMRMALELLRRHEQGQADTLSWLREAWRQGIDSGPAGELDAEALRQEARRRLAPTGERWQAVWCSPGRPVRT